MTAVPPKLELVDRAEVVVMQRRATARQIVLRPVRIRGRQPLLVLQLGEVWLEWVDVVLCEMRQWMAKQRPWPGGKLEQALRYMDSGQTA